MVYFDFIAQKSQGTYPAKKEICDLLSYLLLTFTERTIHSHKSAMTGETELITMMEKRIVVI